MTSFLRDLSQYRQSHTHLRRWILKTSNRRYLLLTSLAAAALVYGASPRQLSPALVSAQNKIHRIETNQWPRSKSIPFTAEELLAIGLTDAVTTFPGVLHNAQLQLASGGATGTATVDFDQLRRLSSTKSSTSNWLLSKLLTGRHPVSVTVKVSSGKGQMTVHPESVSIAGLTASGNTLQFLIQNFLLPRYPNAVVDRPFRLAENIERIDVTPAAAVVVAR
jgi:hypothetical protein